MIKSIMEHNFMQYVSVLFGAHRAPTIADLFDEPH